MNRNNDDRRSSFDDMVEMRDFASARNFIQATPRRVPAPATNDIEDLNAPLLEHEPEAPTPTAKVRRSLYSLLLRV